MQAMGLSMAAASLSAAGFHFSLLHDAGANQARGARTERNDQAARVQPSSSSLSGGLDTTDRQPPGASAASSPSARPFDLQQQDHESSLKLPGTNDSQDFDARHQMEQQSQRIADMVDRFEELLDRIDEFVNQDASLSTTADGAADATLRNLTNGADEVFKSLLNTAQAVQSVSSGTFAPRTEAHNRFRLARASRARRLNVVA